MNTCYNAVDRHVENGRADQTAIIYDSPVTNTIAKITYKELQTRVATFAGVLQSQGLVKGDTVVIYMPMIPEAAIAMLACARLGAIHSVVFGGFAAHELAIRIDHAQPKLVITASGAVEGKKILAYKPLVDSAIEQSAHEVKKVILFQRDIVKAEMKAGPGFRLEGTGQQPQNRLAVSKWMPPIRCISSIPPGPPECRKGSCEIMAAMPLPCTGP